MIRKKEEMEKSIIKNCHNGKGELIAYFVLKDSDKADGIQFMHNDILKPGVSIGKHQHKDKDLMEVYFIAGGNGIMTIDDKEFPVGEGDVSICYPGHSHGIRNNGKEPLHLIVIGLRR